jgi:hypothetical protein
MTKLLEQALRQIEQLPEAEQDAAAGALLDYVKHMRDMRLTDAQVAEVRRRRPIPPAGWYPAPRHANASRDWARSGPHEARLRRLGARRSRGHLRMDCPGQPCYRDAWNLTFALKVLRTVQPPVRRPDPDAPAPEPASPR